MPLLGKEHLIKIAYPDPGTTSDSEKFFYFKLTDEYFKSHHEYFQRCISCFSEIWTCEYTGKSNLTYEQALISENEYELKFSLLPECFHLPILFAVHFIPPQRQLKSLASKISHILSLFLFKGESVQFRKFAQDEKTKNLPFTVEEILPKGLSGKNTIGLKGKDLSDYYNSVSYRLKAENGLEKEAIIKSLRVLERNSPNYSIESIIVFLKKHTRLVGESKPTYVLDSEAIKKYNLTDPSTLSQSYPFASSSVFSELLALSTPNSNGVNSSLPASPAKSKTTSINISSPPAKKPAPPIKSQNMSITNFTTKKDDDDLTEEQKAVIVQRKSAVEAEKKQKEQERIKREEKRIRDKAIQDKYMSKYSVNREDLLCEDLKPLIISEQVPAETTNTNEESAELKKFAVMNPLPAHQASKLSTDQFLDVLMLLEFTESFKELFDPILEREFPSGIDLALMESTLFSKEPNSSFGEILQSFLATAINSLQEDQAVFGKEDNLELVKDIEDDLLRSTVIQSMNDSKLPQKMYGTTLQNLVIDNCTITEVLRLYLLRSGSEFFNLYQTNERRKKGCLMFYDDPGVKFLIENRSIIDTLTTSTVFALTHTEKISILVLLMNQLLTRVTFRDYIFESNENNITTKSLIRDVVRKEQQNDRLSTSCLQKVTQAKLEQESAVSAGEKPNSPASLTRNDPQSPLDPYAPLRRSTRQAAINHEELLEQITANPQEWTLEKAQYIKDKLDNVKSQLIIQSFAYSQIRGNAFLGYDRYYRIYFMSRYFDAILVCSVPESKDVLKKLQQTYVTERNPRIEKFFKNSLGIDLKNPIRVNKVPITKLFEENFEEACKDNSPYTKLISTVSTYKQFEVFLSSLAMRGVNERSLKTNASTRRETFRYVSQKRLKKRDDMLSQNTEGYSQENEQLAKVQKNGSVEHAANDNDENEEPQMEIDEPVMNNHINNAMHPEFEDSRDNFHSPSFLEPELRSGLGLIITDVIVAIVDLRSKLIAGKLYTEGLDNASYEKEFRKWIPESILREVKINDNEDKEVLMVNGYEKKQLNFKNLLESTRDLLTNISYAVDPNYLMEPLGLSQGNKKPKPFANRKNDKQIQISDIRITKRSHFFDKWISKLGMCASFPQLYLFFSTLENSIAWSRSAINKRCHTCCKKTYQIPISVPKYLSGLTNEELGQFYRCNLCDRVFHMGCLKNNALTVESTDWFCMNCRPLIVKQKPEPTPAKRVKIEKVVSSDEASDTSVEMEDEEESESSKEIIPTRSRQKKIENEKKGIIYDENTRLLDKASEKTNTRAMKSATINVLKKLIYQIKILPDAKLLSSPDIDGLNMDQIYQKFLKSKYNSPAEPVEDVNSLISKVKDCYEKDSPEFDQICSVEAKFLEMIDANNLSFFLDD